jgi:ATP-dependent RNA helicase DBP3
MMHHLKQHLKAHPSSEAAPTRILVFALYKKEAQRLEFTIRRGGYTVVGLHGDLDQATRFKALEKFKKGEVNVLVATDVAARGLDIPDVGLVVNVTFPLTTGEQPSTRKDVKSRMRHTDLRLRGLCASMWTNGASWQDR